MLLKLSMLVTIMLGSRSLPSCSQLNVSGMSPSLASQVRRVLDLDERSVGKWNEQIWGGTVVLLGSTAEGGSDLKMKIQRNKTIPQDNNDALINNKSNLTKW